MGCRSYGPRECKPGKRRGSGGYFKLHLRRLFIGELRGHFLLQTLWCYHIQTDPKHHLLSIDFLWTGSYSFKYKYGYRTRGGSTFYLEVLGDTWKSAAAFENFFSYGGGAQFRLSDWLYMDVGVEGDRRKDETEWEEMINSRLELRVGASVILD